MTAEPAEQQQQQLPQVNQQEQEQEQEQEQIDSGHEEARDDIQDVFGYDDFFSGLQQQSVSESNIGGNLDSPDPEDDELFGEDRDEDFQKELDSTKGL